MGWNASSTHQTIEENNFNIYRSAMAIEFNIQHEHSNNYGLIETTNNQPYIAYYCYDNCQINTY